MFVRDQRHCLQYFQEDQTNFGFLGGKYISRIFRGIKAFSANLYLLTFQRGQCTALFKILIMGQGFAAFACKIEGDFANRSH